METAPRRGTARNEMTLFRYDAVLHVGCEAPVTEPDWQDGTNLTLPVLAHQLHCRTRAFGYRCLVNARLRDAHHVRRSYLPRHCAAVEAAAVDPEEACSLAEENCWTPVCAGPRNGPRRVRPVACAVGRHPRTLPGRHPVASSRPAQDLAPRRVTGCSHPVWSMTGKRS
ncbi:hypothetical protein NKH18_42410 [Streptomyces sp. M10(2022)]